LGSNGPIVNDGFDENFLGLGELELDKHELAHE
jgi:hypothetical protein